MLVVELVDAHARAAQDRARVAVDRVHLTRWAETFITARHPAVRAIGKPVNLEAAILCGPVGDALVSESRNAALIGKSSVGIGASGLGKLIQMKTPASTENPGKEPVDSSDDNGDFTGNPAYSIPPYSLSAETPICAHGRGAGGAAVCGRIPK